jgi:hypothetical protein
MGRGDKKKRRGERERERERQREGVGVCVRERERERENRFICYTLGDTRIREKNQTHKTHKTINFHLGEAQESPRCSAERRGHRLRIRHVALDK